MYCGSLAWRGTTLAALSGGAFVIDTTADDPAAWPEPRQLSDWEGGENVYGVAVLEDGRVARKGDGWHIIVVTPEKIR